jgi:hypothetical protein
MVSVGRSIPHQIGFAHIPRFSAFAGRDYSTRLSTTFCVEHGGDEIMMVGHQEATL